MTKNKTHFYLLRTEDVIAYIKSGSPFYNKYDTKHWIINEFLVMVIRKGKPAKTGNIVLWESYAQYLQREQYYTELTMEEIKNILNQPVKL